MTTFFKLTCNEKSFTTFDIDIFLLIKQLSSLSMLKNRIPLKETLVIDSVLSVLEKFVDIAGKSDDLDLAYQQPVTDKAPDSKAIVYVVGGLIEEVVLNNIRENIQFILVDEDIDGGSPECIMRCNPDKYYREELYVAELPTRDVEDIGNPDIKYLLKEVDRFMQEDRDKSTESSSDYWQENSQFPVCDWQYEVANGDTRRGYQEWVEAKDELAKEMVAGKKKTQ